MDRAKKAAVTGDALDALVEKRSALIGDAKAIAPDLDTTGKTEHEIRKAAVAAKLGDKAVEGRSDSYIEARFETLAEDARGSDPTADALKAGGTSTSDAHAAYRKNLADAWRT